MYVFCLAMQNRQLDVTNFAEDARREDRDCAKKNEKASLQSEKNGSNP